MHSFKSASRKELTKITAGIISVICITFIGVHFLFASHAQSPFASINTTNGIFSGLANTQTGSIGKYVQFGYPPTTALAVHVDGDQLINRGRKSNSHVGH